MLKSPNIMQTMISMDIFVRLTSYLKIKYIVHIHMHELVDLVLKRTQMFIVSAHVFYLNLCILYHVGTDRH